MAVPLYCIFHNHNHIGAETLRAGGLQPPCKRLIEQLVTRINEAHRIIVKQVVYDEFMKQIRTVRHSFSMANYRVQLAVTPSIKNNHKNNNTVLKKKLTNKYT